ncbi:hypothetical protein GCM10008957_31120 [Deinococcus ruber]|uniref:Uncharacterized protein n=1 Tax=Deinococcus ruber TaxID=1848197 RepID=A0A918CCS2_9DEIO|nr:hypothetical protein GCM10008957_31120 [Deinococcus ruber]
MAQAGQRVLLLDLDALANLTEWISDRPVAQLGGWCWGWPDEAWDTREAQRQQLLLVTYQDSELWWTG